VDLPEFIWAGAGAVLLVLNHQPSGAGPGTCHKRNPDWRRSRTQSFRDRLATILWLIALRREGEQVAAWQFLRLGLVVMPPALLLALFALTAVSP
jgi:hypothetical protein